MKDKIVYKGETIEVIHRSKKFNSKNVYFEFVNRRKVAIIIPFFNAEKILLTYQFRAPFKKYLFEFPGGKAEENESLVNAGIRECEEETGWVPKKLTELIEIYTSPHFSNEIVKVYLGEYLFKGHIKHSRKEYIKIETLSLSDIEKLIRNDEFKDAKSLIAYHSLINYLERLNDVK